MVLYSKGSLIMLVSDITLIFIAIVKVVFKFSTESSYF